MSIFTKILGDPHEREVNRLRKRVSDIHAFAAQAKGYSDAELKNAYARLQERYSNGEKLPELLPEAFALVQEAASRTLEQRHYDVQFIGGMVLNDGRIAEMKTGEGKTLVATLALSLQALTKKGAHLVTVNDYLARRDCAWMGPVYHALGLSVGCIQSDRRTLLFDPEHTADESSYEHLRDVERAEAYQADITYGTNNEFGFDFLRDNMAQKLEDKVQRPLHFAIVDEVDSILIDEARTPLIISGPASAATSDYQRYAQLVQQLHENEHYNIDEKQRAVTLTQTGIQQMEQALGVKNIYDVSGVTMAHHIEQALKAKAMFKRDKDYLVRDGQVLIVDEFTGRVLEGRRYSEGLHQAIEAKEGVEIKQENVTLATITYQNYFRLYETLSGMTGTAATEAEEFSKIYNLEVVVIPTHRDLMRNDGDDLIYKTAQAKYAAIIDQIEELHIKGQPVLVGTVTVERSELLSQLLTKRGIEHSVLNAKHHQSEAEVVAQAGTPGAVTIATNMAGRGTDIVLGGAPREKNREQEVKELGGLYVLGSERHESRRIDNQLRGRSGRQGDPGETQFYVSLEDDLMRIFGSERVQGIMNTLKLPEDVPIQNKMISKALESAQKRVEGHNFDSRKHLVEYDDIMNTHRDVIYKRRDEILASANENTDRTREIFMEYIRSEIDRVVGVHAAGAELKDWNFKEIQETLSSMFGLPKALLLDPNGLPKEAKTTDIVKLRDFLSTWANDQAVAAYEALEERIGDPKSMRHIERLLLLRSIDTFWIEHLEQMKHLRESIGLQGYGQRDPLVEYKKESYFMFTQLLEDIERHVVNTIFKVQLKPHTHAPKKEGRSAIERQEEHTTSGGSDKDKKKEKPLTSEKVGRNDPCPCGSGKKYKKCHGAA